MYGGIFKAHSVNTYLLHVIWYALLQSKPVGVQSTFSVRRIGMYDLLHACMMYCNGLYTEQELDGSTVYSIIAVWL